MVDGLVAGLDDNYIKEQPDDPEPRPCIGNVRLGELIMK